MLRRLDHQLSSWKNLASKLMLYCHIATSRSKPLEIEGDSYVQPKLPHTPKIWNWTLRNRGLILLLLGSILLSGCAATEKSSQATQNSKSDTPSETDASKESRSEDSVELEEQKPVIPEPDWKQATSLSTLDKCKVPDPRPRAEQELYRGARQGGLLGKDPVGFTDWRRSGLLPITSDLNIIFARISFQDAPPSPETVPDDYLENQAQKMTNLGFHWSEGAFEYKFQIVEEWVQVPVNHADYPVSSGDDVDHSPEAYALAEGNMETVAQLIVENLPGDLNFTEADIVVPVWSTNITEFTMPVTWRGGGLKAPDGKRTNLIFMGNSTYMHTNLDYTWSILGHDFLHLQGLNEHAPGAKFGTHIGGMTKPSYWGMSALMPAWETFLMNWFEDSQVHCIKAEELEQTEQVILTSLETLGGQRKTIVIPTEDYKALVVESRRPVGYSATWPKSNSGLLVYEVDTNRDHLDHGQNECSNSRENPKWSYYLLPDGAQESSECNNPEPYFMQPGESVTHSGVKIELVFSADSVDYVQVTPVASEPVVPAVQNRNLDSDFNGAVKIVLAAREESLRGSHCDCCGCSPLN